MKINTNSIFKVPRENSSWSIDRQDVTLGWTTCTTQKSGYKNKKNILVNPADLLLHSESKRKHDWSVIGSSIDKRSSVADI